MPNIKNMSRINFIQVRSGLAAHWSSENPVLGQHEPGFETDTGRWKSGDGATAWADLSYADGGSVILKSPDNTLHQIVVANDGTLSTQVV